VVELDYTPKPNPNPAGRERLRQGQALRQGPRLQAAAAPGELWLSHTPITPHTCTCRMHMHMPHAHAHAACTCTPHAHAHATCTCTCNMHMHMQHAHAHATCTCTCNMHMHMQHAHAHAHAYGMHTRCQGPGLQARRASRCVQLVIARRVGP
jgi:hypothetical protein